MKNKKVKIIQDEKTPVPADVLATDILKMSAAIKKLNEGQLNEKAVLVLLANSTGLTQRVIKTVLDGINDLAKDYTK